MTLDFSKPPDDDASIAALFPPGCSAVGPYFLLNPISVGDCFQIDDEWFVVVGVDVKCEGASKYAAGERVGPPSHVHSYAPLPVEVELWLRPAATGECG